MFYVVDVTRSFRASVKYGENLRNSTVGDGFHFQHRNPRKFPIESLKNWTVSTATSSQYLAVNCEPIV
jgi:hypothetical protein